jgi:hypothetical protein
VCSKKPATTGSTAWVGYLLGAIVVVGGAIIWLRYKRIKAEKNPIEKKINSFEKKIP